MIIQFIFSLKINFRAFVLLIIAASVFVSCAFSREMTSELTRKADQIMIGVDDTIMRINSGICRISGETVPSGGKKTTDNVFIAFDYSKHQYHFKNGELKWSLLTPEYYYEIWHPNTPNVSVKRSSASIPEDSGNHAYFIDVQIAFCFVPHGVHNPLEYQHSVLHQELKSFKKVDYAEIGHDIVCVTVEFPNPKNFPKPLQWKCYVNTAKGYTVERIENNFSYISDISWKKINNNWVPVTYKFTDSNAGMGVEWKFDWEKVNENVDADYFDLEKMLHDQEDGAIMLSEEPGSPPVIIGKIGNGFVPLPVQKQHKFYSYLRYTLMTIGFLVFVIGLGKKLYDFKT